MGKTYYTPRAAAAKLGVDQDQLVQLVRDKKLRIRQYGDRKLFRIDEVDALASHKGAGGTGDAGEGVFVPEADRVRIDQAEHASGSGLLELTQEQSGAWSVDALRSAGGDGRISWGAGAETGGAHEAWMTVQEAAVALGVNVQAVEERAEAGELESRARDDGVREVLVTSGPITGTVLGMANKLAEAQEAELKRARRLSLTGWITVAVVTVGAVAALWWAATQTGHLAVERERTSNLRSNLTRAEADLRERKDQSAKLAGELETLRAEGRRQQGEREKLQSDLLVAREALIESGASVKILTLNLETAKVKADLLDADLKATRAELAAVKARLEAMESTSRPATAPATTGPNSEAK